MIVPALSTVIGLIFFHIAAFGCNTFKAASTSNGYFRVYLYTVNYGYWSLSNAGGCTKLPYSSFSLSGAIGFGRFIGVLGALLSWVVFAFIVGASFLRYPRSGAVFRTMAACMVVLSAFSLLLVVDLSYDGSQLGGGGDLAIAAAIIWLGGAVSVLFVKERPRRDATATNDDGDIEQQPAYMTAINNDINVAEQTANKTAAHVEVVINSDGSMTEATTTTTEFPHGGKTIGETVETTRA